MRCFLSVSCTRWLIISFIHALVGIKFSFLTHFFIAQLNYSICAIFCHCIFFMFLLSPGSAICCLLLFVGGNDRCVMREFYYFFGSQITKNYECTEIYIHILLGFLYSKNVRKNYTSILIMKSSIIGKH